MNSSLIVSLIFSLLVASHISAFDRWYPPSLRAASLMHKLENQFISEMQLAHGMICLGRSVYDDFPAHIDLCFTLPLTPNISEARELYVQCLNRFVNIINESKHMRPWLPAYPIQTKHAGFSIQFEDSSNPNHINRIFHLYNGDLVYVYYSKIPANEKQFTETYEEALAKVEEMKNSVAVKLPQE